MRRVVHPGERVTEAIVRAVADVTGRDPMDLQPLATAIDPDAVEALFPQSPGGDPRSLTFHYAGCRVTVDREAVTVEPVQE